MDFARMEQVNEGVPIVIKSKVESYCRGLKSGDVVLVLDQDILRGRWSLGRILQTYPRRDGDERVAKNQPSGKTLLRSIHKLVPLELNEL